MRYSWWVFCQNLNIPFVKFPPTFSPKDKSDSTKFQQITKRVLNHWVLDHPHTRFVFQHEKQKHFKLSASRFSSYPRPTKTNQRKQSERNEEEETNSALCLPTRLGGLTWLWLLLIGTLQIQTCTQKSCQIWLLMPTNAKAFSLLRWVLACETRMWGEMYLLGLLSLLLYSTCWGGFWRVQRESGRRTSGQCS